MLDQLIQLSLTDLPLLAQSGNPITDITNTFHVEGPFLIAQILNFLLVAFILYYFAFRPVLSKVDERQRKIDDGLQYAEEMKHKLAEAEKKYNEELKRGTQEAQQAIEEAREQSKRILEKHTKEANARAEEIIQNAKKSAEREREKMVEEVRAEMVSMVVDTTSKVLRSELDDSMKRKYGEAALRELKLNN